MLFLGGQEMNNLTAKEREKLLLHRFHTNFLTSQNFSLAVVNKLRISPITLICITLSFFSLTSFIINETNRSQERRIWQIKTRMKPNILRIG